MKQRNMAIFLNLGKEFSSQEQFKALKIANALKKYLKTPHM